MMTPKNPACHVTMLKCDVILGFPVFTEPGGFWNRNFIRFYEAVNCIFHFMICLSS